MDANRTKLETWLKAHPSYKAVGEIFWAQCDGPFVIPILKTNEALVEVQATHRRLGRNKAEQVWQSLAFNWVK